jgi:hypothetical protein
MPDRQTKTYKVVAISLYIPDAAEADRLTELLRQGGWSNANRSLVIREGLLRLQEDLAGKSREEVVRYFLDRQAKRANTRALSPSAAMLDHIPEPAEIGATSAEMTVSVRVGLPEK